MREWSDDNRRGARLLAQLRTARAQLPPGTQRFSMRYDAGGRVVEVRAAPDGDAAPARSLDRCRARLAELERSLTTPSHGHIPASAPAADTHALIRADAERLWRRHQGNVPRLYADPEVRVLRVEVMYPTELDRRARAGGLPACSVWGLCDRNDRRGYVIRFASTIWPEERLRVQLHELGHARADTLARDFSEATADAWAAAWRACDVAAARAWA